MRVAIISGGRDYHPTPADLSCLDATLQLHEISHVIHGADASDMVCHRHIKSRGNAILGVWPELKDGTEARNATLASMAHAMTDYLPWNPCKMPLWVLFPGDTANAEGLATHDGFEIVRIGKS